MPKGIYTRKPEHIKKLVKHAKKYLLRGGWNRGIKMNYSPEVLAKISRKGWRHSIDSKMKISRALTGRVVSKNTIAKLREGTLKRYKLGKRMGFPKREKHPNWVGGITPLRKQIRECQQYKEWHRNCLKRDNYTCTLCHIRGVRLNVDHYPKQFAQILKESEIKQSKML